MEIFDQNFQNLKGERFIQSEEKPDTHFILLWFVAVSKKPVLFQ